jgi:MYXO-CTERM domain-containing protein
MDNEPNRNRRRSSALGLGSVLLLATFGAPACASAADEPVARQSQAIAGGTADVSHQDVFLLARESKNSGALCTATLIAPNLLLTARHCVSPGTGDDRVLCGESVLGDPYPPSAFFATNDAQPHNESPFFTATDVRVPVQGTDTCGYDVALIILAQNVPSDISVPAVPRIDREVEPGELYTAVGYGLNEDGDPNGVRMERVGLSVACQPGSCGDGVESTEFRGDTGICSGDSGGPALDADGKVVGVVSRGGPNCDTPVYGTVTAWRDFIIATATDAAALGGYEPPFWVTTKSSDPPVSVTPGAGGASEMPTGKSAGEACGSTADCQSDLVCYAGSGAKGGICTKTCKETSECGDGMACQNAGAVSVCVAPTGHADDSKGCTVSAASAPTSLGALWLAALGAALSLRRRRRA